LYPVFGSFAARDRTWAGPGLPVVGTIQGNPQFTPAGVGNAPTAWSIVETGDFDGDGMTDLLWQDTSGNVAIWFMFAEHVTQSAGVGNVSTVWSIQGANAD
jgi:hypothetical protein